MEACAVGMQYLVFKQVARDVAEALGIRYAETPRDAARAGCRDLILVDNVNERVGFVARRWKAEAGGNVVFYAVAEGPVVVSPRDGYGRHIAELTTIVTPSGYARRWLEEAGYRVEAVVPHGMRVPENVKGYEGRARRAIYRAYYIKRKFPPYGIAAVRKALSQGYPITIYVRDDLYPNGLEPRHQQLLQLLGGAVVVENSWATPREKVLSDIEGSLFFLNLADGGGFELEVLESMALGTPVITAYFPPISEYYPKSELTFDPAGEWDEQYPYLTIVHHAYSPDDMVEAIRRAFEMPRGRWEALSAELRERAKEYDYRKVYQAFSKLLG